MVQRSKDGRYDISKLEARCTCGHTLAGHLAGGERACLSGPHGDSCSPDRQDGACNCLKFKKGKNNA